MNLEDTIILLGGLSVLVTFLAIGAAIGDAVLRYRDNRAQRRRDNRVHYTYRNRRQK